MSSSSVSPSLEDFHQIVRMQSQWVERLFIQNESLIKSLVEAINMLNTTLSKLPVGGSSGGSGTNTVSFYPLDSSLFPPGKIHPWGPTTPWYGGPTTSSNAIPSSTSSLFDAATNNNFGFGNNPNNTSNTFSDTDKLLTNALESMPPPSSSSSSSPQQPPYSIPSFNPFKDMDPAEKTAILTMFTNLPKLIEQKEKSDKEKEKEDKEWKAKLDKKRTN